MPLRWLVRFLPYLETAEGARITSESFGHKKARGYGHKSLEELFETSRAARDRFAFLVASGMIERAEVRQSIPGQGMVTTLVDDWNDKSTGA